MISWLQTVFGVYTPITYSSNGIDIIPDGMSGVNWEYLAGVIIFCVFLYSVFRFLGGIFRHD